jgi:hypothetical protein
LADRLHDAAGPIPSRSTPMNKSTLFVYAGYAIAAVALYVILLVLPG